MEIKDNQEQDNGEIGKEPDKMNLEDLLEYIRLFTHLFNKKKLKKLPKPQVIYFRLCNSPGIFQRMMNSIF